jgi:hypothetical protein
MDAASLPFVFLRLSLNCPRRFALGSMSDSLCLARLRPRASGYATAELVHGPPEDIDTLVNMEEGMYRSFVSGSAAGVGRIFPWPISWENAIHCDGESEEESGRVDNEIAVAFVDLESSDDDGTIPEE